MFTKQEREYLMWLLRKGGFASAFWGYPRN